jgi:dsDNA-specific endonuclease/ATPase MutS2
MEFKNGEQVTILNEAGTFVFVGVKNSRALIEDEFGFEREIEFRYLVKRRNVAVEVPVVKSDDVPTGKIKKEAKHELPEIDLHIENLLKSAVGMSAHDKFTFQISTFKRFVNEMLRQRKTKFRVIHGIGEGKLKSELRLLLQNKKGFQMHDDNVVNGKIGASLIEVQITKAEEL